MIIGIVGNEAAKFTSGTEMQARKAIWAILSRPGVTGMVSGGCHLGGVDIWAEEEARMLGLEVIVHYPRVHRWSGGYRERNILIAKQCVELDNIVIANYPPHYTGRRFTGCYHCGTADHVKSGGCWTQKYARKLGKQTVRWVVFNDHVEYTVS